MRCTGVRGAAANSPWRVRAGDAYAAQMTRNPPESTGYEKK
jgi:hypothetical protein